jgi:tRNA 2-selenouridine synthase
MPVTKLPIQEFIQYSESFPVFDVRSSGEYNHAQIPGAYSLSLFTDEERKIVGTAYKQEGKQIAIKIGLDFRS